MDVACRVLAAVLAAVCGAAELPAPRLARPPANARVLEPAVFEWAEIPEAAAYTIQISTREDFSAPLAVDETTGVPGYTNASLAPGPLWWRVRAIDRSGAPGEWSEPRRFEAFTPPPAGSIFALTVFPGEVTGGLPVDGLVTLNAPAPDGGATVALSSSDAAAVTPHHVIVPAGQLSAGFVVDTAHVSESRTVRITAGSRTAGLTIIPPPPPARLGTFAVNPANVTGGAASLGIVYLTSAARGPRGAVVELSSDDESLAEVPASVTVAPGQRSASFPIRTGRGTMARSVVLTAASGGVTRRALLRLNGAARSEPLPAPVPEQPREGEWVGDGSLVTFSWSEVMGAASYTVEVGNSLTFAGGAVVTRTVPATGVSVGPFGAQGFWWRVRANDANGAPGRWSAPRPFNAG
ncbi:MAG: hypothetical protein ACM336_16535 [Acidobacteriota bacterium]